MENKIDQDREKIIKINDKIENEMRNKNIIGVFAFTRQLIKVIDTSHEYPSIYYENYRLIFTYLFNIRNFLMTYLKNNNYLTYKTYYNMLSPLESGLLYNIYFNFIIFDMEVIENENIVEEKMNYIVGLIQKLNSPLIAFFANYFCFLHFTPYMFSLPIKIKIDFYLQFINLMNDEFLTYYNMENEEIKKDAKNIYKIILEIMNSFGQIKELDIEQFKNQIIDSILNLINNGEIYNDIILNWIINDLNEKYLFVCLDKVLMKISTLTKFEDNLGKKTVQLIQRLLKYYKEQDNSLIIDNFSPILRPLIIISNNSKDFQNFELSEFLENLEFIMIFINEFTKNYHRYRRSKIIDTFLNVIVTFLEKIDKKRNKSILNPEKTFELEEEEEDEEGEDAKEKNNEENHLSEKEIDNLEKSAINYDFYIFKENDLNKFESIFKIIISNKVTLFQIGNLPTIIKYMDPYHRKKKSIDLLNKLVYEESKIETDNKTYYVKMIIKNILTSYTIANNKILISDSVKENIKKVINLINNPNPETYFQLLLIISDIYEGTLKENTEGTVGIFCDSILYLTYKIFINCKKEEKINNDENEDKKNLDFFLERDSIIKTEESGISTSLEEYSIVNENETLIENEEVTFDSTNMSKEKCIEMISYILLFLKERIKIQFQFFPYEIIPVLNKAIILFEQMKIYKDKFYKEYIEYIQLYLKTLWKQVKDNNKKIEYIVNIINTISQTSILTKEDYIEVAESIVTIGQSLEKRADLIKIQLNVVDLYTTNYFNDKNKVKEIIKEVQEQAEFAIIRSEHLFIANIIFEKMIELLKKDKDYINKEDVIRFIEVINLQLEKIASEENNEENKNEDDKENEEKYVQILEEITNNLKKNENELYELLSDK